ANVVHEFSYEPESKGVVISVSSDFVSGLGSIGGVLNAAVLRLAARRLVLLSFKESVEAIEELVTLLLSTFERMDESRRDMLRYLFGCLLLELDRTEVRHGARNPNEAAPDDRANLYKRFQDVLQSVIGSVGFSTAVAKPQPHTVESFAAKLST